MTQKQTTGIILLNMGGPEKLADVRPFLYNLFSDREIIRLGPRLLQKPIAWFIARKRAPKSRVTYEKIGGGSPLARITRQQAQALALSLQNEGDFKVSFAMRYWPPTAAEILETFNEQSITNIIAITLYPHFSKATTGSSLRHLQRANEQQNSYVTISDVNGALDEMMQLGEVHFAYLWQRSTTTERAILTAVSHLLEGERPFQPEEIVEQLAAYGRQLAPHDVTAALNHLVERDIMAETMAGATTAYTLKIGLVGLWVERTKRLTIVNSIAAARTTGSK